LLLTYRGPANAFGRSFSFLLPVSENSIPLPVAAPDDARETVFAARRGPKIVSEMSNFLPWDFNFF
jgi:hypothetical protein